MKLGGLVDIIGERTKQLHTGMNNYNKTEGNKFYAEGDKMTLLNEFVDGLKIIVDKNNYLETTFREIQADISKVGDMSTFIDHLNEIEDMVK